MTEKYLSIGNCTDCIFWIPFNEERNLNERGRCFRFPPSIIHLLPQEANDDNAVARNLFMQPETSGACSCGEFMSTEEYQEKYKK